MGRRRRAGRRATAGAAGLGSALGLTLASALIWGVAHIRAGRRAVGYSLLALFLLLLIGVPVTAFIFRDNVKEIAVQHAWLDGITAGIIGLALVWAAIVIRSYQVVRPPGMSVAIRATAGTLVIILAIAVCTPLVWAARDTYALRDALTSIFPAHGAHSGPIDTDDPWKDKPRVNILLLGGDGAGDRHGVRTDSITVASVDTTTGNTVLLSIPRNLQDFEMPQRLQARWPDGFTGYNPGDEGLINELFQDAEEHPDLVPGYGKGERGPRLVSETVSHILGIRVDYYILVNLFGFADIVDAIGGVKVNVGRPIPYGGPEDGSAPTGTLQPGYRKLNGKQALWFGRSRTASSDFDRMGRQKCLMKAIAEQADPEKVLSRFQDLAAAAKKTLSTNIPEPLLPALIKLSGAMKRGAQIQSLMLVPPTIHVYRPDLDDIHRMVTKATQESSHPPSPSPAAPKTTGKRKRPEKTPSASPSPSTRSISLSSACG